jgi:predicted enzyme related to lactoylglutathione lyase
MREPHRGAAPRGSDPTDLIRFDSVRPVLTFKETDMAANRIVHFEIPAERPDVIARFYGDLFGWDFQQIPVPGLEFWRCDAGDGQGEGAARGGPGIAGAVMKRQNAGQPCMNYVGVEDIDATIEAATRLGATVALPKMPVPGGHAIAALVDPEGNLFGLLEQSPS